MYDFDPETMFSYCAPEEIRVARKVHKCSECGEDILPGNSYSHFRGIFRGKWEIYNTCSLCKEDWKMVMDFDWTEGITYGGLIDVIEEAINDELIEKDDPLVKRWVPFIEKKLKEAEQSRFSCPLQCLT